jgi:hypothetical protein
MNMLHTPVRKTAISAAITLALGVGATAYTPVASAKIIKSSWTGVFTMLDPAGSLLLDTASSANNAPWSKSRTNVSGTLTFNTSTGEGSGTVAAFSFFGSGQATATTITMQAIGDGVGGPGTLVLGNMGFNWNGNAGIPVSIVLDAAGFFGGTCGGDGFTAGEDCNNVGALPGSNSIAGALGGPNADGTIGPSPMATTGFNTTNIDTDTTKAGKTILLGDNPSGTLPLISNTISGSPMRSGPFAGFNANFDITTAHITSVTAAADTVDPVITVADPNPDNVVQGGTYTDPGATCTDNVDATPTLVVTGLPVDTSVANVTKTITYTCTDDAGNEAISTRDVNVTAPGVPTIALKGANPITHECATTYTDAGATASDPDKNAPNDGLGDGTEDFDLQNNALINFTRSAIPANPVVDFTVTYNATDSDANAAPAASRTVTLEDTTDPVVTLVGANPLVIESTDQPFADPGATATDSCAPANPAVVSSGDVDFTFDEVDNQGKDTISNSVTYTAEDAEHNTSSVQRTVIVQRAEPVVTLLGNGTQSIELNGTFSDDGVTVHDVQEGDATYGNITGAGDFAPDAAGGYPQTLHVAIGFEAAGSAAAASAGKQAAAAVVSVNSVDTSKAGKYTITYTTTDAAANDSAPITRTVTVGAAFSAKLSNFTMIDPGGSFVGGAKDIIATWDSSLYTDPATQTAANMILQSAKPTPFFGATWRTTTVRVFGPGDYEFETCPPPVNAQNIAADGSTQCGGNTKLKVTVGPGQLGAHMLFDWPLNEQNQVTGNTNRNIDVFVVWEQDAVFQGSPTDNDANLGAKGAVWDLASVDGNGDGVPGIAMIDGPFKGFRANFNLSEEGVDVELPPEPHDVGDADTGGGSGSMDGWTLGGLVAGLGALLRRRRRQ